MNKGRFQHTATLLPNGKVLVAGGYSPPGDPNSGDYGLASAEVYDPASGTWTPTGSMTISQNGHSAVLLPNGLVLVAGGFNQFIGNLASAELYDPGSGTWTGTGSMKTVRSGHTATLLPNGWVLAAGGGTSSAEVYKPNSAKWEPPVGSMSEARVFHTATVLPSGQVLVTGGNYTSSSELY